MFRWPACLFRKVACAESFPKQLLRSLGCSFTCGLLPMTAYTSTSACSQEEALSSVQSILSSSRSVARTLLIHFLWNKDALFGEQATCLWSDDVSIRFTGCLHMVLYWSAGRAASGTAFAAAWWHQENHLVCSSNAGTREEQVFCAGTLADRDPEYVYKMAGVCVRPGGAGSSGAGPWHS